MASFCSAEQPIDLSTLHYNKQRNALIGPVAGLQGAPRDWPAFLHLVDDRYLLLPFSQLSDQSCAWTLPENIDRLKGPFVFVLVAPTRSIKFTASTIHGPWVAESAGIREAEAQNPAIWSTGHRLSPVLGRSTFQETPNHISGWTYNPEQKPDEASFGLAFESRFQNLPQGVDTEHYFHWTAPDKRTQRRIYQANIAWDVVGGGLSTSRPAGWTRWSYDVNRFGVGNGAPFKDDFSIDLDAAPHVLSFNGVGRFQAGLSLGGNLQVEGRGENSIAGDAVFFSDVLTVRGTQPSLQLVPLSGDASIEIARTGDGAERLSIGAYAGGKSGSGTTNLFAIDLTGPAANRLRGFAIRASSNGGQTTAEYFRLDPTRGAIAVGPEPKSGIATGATFAITGSLNVNGGANITRLSHGTVRLVDGVAVVEESSVTAATRVVLTIQSPAGEIGTPYVAERTAGEKFVIRSTSRRDGSEVAWLLIEP